MDLHPIAVELDLVQPRVTLWRAVALDRFAGREEDRGAQHAPSVGSSLHDENSAFANKVYRACSIGDRVRTRKKPPSALAPGLGPVGGPQPELCRLRFLVGSPPLTRR